MEFTLRYAQRGKPLWTPSLVTWSPAVSIGCLLSISVYGEIMV